MLWGTVHGLFMVLDRILEKNKIIIWKPLRWLLTFGVVNVLWLLFSADSIAQWAEMLKKMIHINSISISNGMLEKLQGPEVTIFRDLLNMDGMKDDIFGYAYGLFAVVVIMMICLLPENNHRDMKKLTFPSMLLAAVAFVWGVLCLGGDSTFVYFGF